MILKYEMNLISVHHEVRDLEAEISKHNQQQTVPLQELRFSPGKHILIDMKELQ